MYKTQSDSHQITSKTSISHAVCNSTWTISGCIWLLISLGRSWKRNMRKCSLARLAALLSHCVWLLVLSLYRSASGCLTVSSLPPSLRIPTINTSLAWRPSRRDARFVLHPWLHSVND